MRHRYGRKRDFDMLEIVGINVFSIILSMSLS